MKTCAKCGEMKPKDSFSPAPKGKEGLHSRCRVCRSTANSEWNKRNADSVKPRMRSWRKENAEKVKEYQRTYSNINKERIVEKAQQWAKAHPEQIQAIRRRAKVKSRYGITHSEYESILAMQGGACAICGTEDTGYWDRFHIDHCHTTGHVRGLLCTKCNTGLGMFLDNRELLLSAIKYLDSQK